MNQPATPTSAPSKKSPMSWLLPAKAEVISELRVLLDDSRMSIDVQAACALKDTVIAIELIKSANATDATASRPTITTIRGSIQRLGNAEVHARLDEILTREPIDTPGVSEWLEIYREHCRILSQLTGIVAEVKITPYVDECRTSSIFTYLGDMLAAAFLREEYVVNAHACTRKVLNYRLAQKYHLDPEQTQIKYLQKNGIPEVLIFPLDRKATTKDPRGAAMRPICTASQELFEAFINGKWDRYKTIDKLPSSSLVKVLQLSEVQYQRLIERIEALLNPEK